MKKILLFFAFLAITTLGSAVFWIQTESAQKLIGKEIAKVIEESLGTPVKIQELQLQFPLIADAKNISGNGFCAENIHVKLSPWNLLKGNLVIRTLKADRLHVNHVSSSATFSHLPTIHIDFFSIQELVYNDYRFRTEGEVHSGEIFSAAIQVNYEEETYMGAVNGEETGEGLLAHFFCRRNEDSIEGTFSLDKDYFSFKNLQFCLGETEGTGHVYLNENQQWKFFLEIRQSKLKIKDYLLTNCYGELKGIASQNSVEGYFNGTVKTGKASCDFIWDYNNLLHLNSLTIATPDFFIEGNCCIALQEKQITGYWKGELPTYGVSFQMALDTDQAELSASATHFHYAERTFHNLNLVASIQNLFEIPFGKIKLSGEYEQWKLIMESEINLAKEAYPFHLQSRWDKKGICQAEGHWNLNQIFISNCHGEILNQTFKLKEPFSLSSKKITPISFYLGDGHVTASYQWDNQFYCECHHLSLDFMRLIEKAPLLNGNVDFFLNWNGNDGTVRLLLSDVELLEKKQPSLPCFNVDMQATFDRQSMQGSGELIGEKLNPILFGGKVTEENLDLHFEAKDEIAQLMHVLFLQNIVHLSGDASVFIDVVGSWKNPEIYGILEWKNGTFELPDTGILYKEITARLIGTGKDLILEQAQAKDLHGGDLTATGKLELLPDQFYPFILNLQLKSAPLLQLDYATAQGDGFLKLSGSLKEAILAGKLEAHSLTVLIPEKSKPTIPTLDIHYINQSLDELQPTSSLSVPTSWPIYLDLTCQFKKPISIKGKNFKSDWNGHLQVKGTATTPLLYGDFKVLTGEYNFRGKPFEMKEGSIFFAGEKRTSLYVVGRQEIDDVEVNAILKGTLESPSLSFRSNPPMSQREILSYILFGHRSSELTPFQGVELSESITDITSSQSSDFITRIGERIGLDKIDISSSDVKVGKYISKGVMVSIDKSMTDEANKLSVEAKLIKDVRFQGQIGDNSEGQLLIKWKKDY